MNAPLIIPELVSLDADLGSTKAEVITSAPESSPGPDAPTPTA